MAATISVIVPVYKAEAYLDRCVESILAQSFGDFELILVDDGSPDRCPQMCDDWAARDSRIRVIHKTNGGPQDAVKHGVDAAKGAYIAFCDSDDWVEPAFLETLYRGITEHGAEIVQCGFQNVYPGRNEPRDCRLQVLIREAADRAFLENMARGAVKDLRNSRCDKLYRAALLKKAIAMCDPSVVMGEDFLMNFAAATMAKGIVLLDTPPLYNYFFNTVSISSTYNPKHKYGKDAFYANLKAIADTRGCELDIHYMKNRRYAQYIYECAICAWPRGDRRAEIRQIAAMTDRRVWRSCIRREPVPAKRLCLLLTYLGLTGPMLWLVDRVKAKRGPGKLTGGTA